MELFFGWILFSIVAGAIAGSKGRSGFGYFFLSLVLSPLIGIILAWALPALNAHAEAGGPSPATHVKCPDCRELVLKEARVCKHCGCRLIPESEQPPKSIEQLMAEYGVSKDIEGKYWFRSFRYDRAEDAVRYARKIAGD